MFYYKNIQEKFKAAYKRELEEYEADSRLDHATEIASSSLITAKVKRKASLKAAEAIVTSTKKKKIMLRFIVDINDEEVDVCALELAHSLASLNKILSNESKMAREGKNIVDTIINPSYQVKKRRNLRQYNTINLSIKNIDRLLKYA